VVMPHAGCGKCPACLSGEHIHCIEQRDVLSETGSTTGIACYAEYLLKPDYLLWKAPDDISTSQAAMAVCALGPTFTAMRRMQVTPRDTVLVSGCGAVGLGAIVNARTIGARTIALEINPYRVDLAKALGASSVFDPRDPELLKKVRAATSGYGADAALETSNNEAAAAVALELVRARGRLAFVTWSGALPVPRITGKGVDIFGCWHWNHQEHGEEMAQRIRLAAPLLEKLSTHRFTLNDVQQAFALQESGFCGKVLLLPAGDAL
jgi:L-iditol 2-dehydrogenase